MKTTSNLDRAIARAVPRPPYVNKRAFLRLCGVKLTDRQTGALAVLALPALIERLMALKTGEGVRA